MNPLSWLDILNAREKRRFAVVVALVIISSPFQLLGMTSVLPFLTAVGEPERIHKERVLSWIYNAFGFQSDVQFLLWSGVGCIITLTLTSAIFATTQFAVQRFSGMRDYSIGRRVFESFLSRSYPFFLKSNPNDLAKTAIGEVQSVVTSIVLGSLTMLSNACNALVILFGLFLIDPYLSGAITLVLGIVYGFIYLSVRRRLKTLAANRRQATFARQRVANEALAAIKQIKLLNLESFFVQQYSKPSLEEARAISTGRWLVTMPRYALETIGFGGLIGIVIYLLATGQDTTRAFPLMGIYAFAGFRLLPAFQGLFASVATFRLAEPSLQLVRAALASHSGAPHAGNGTSLALERTIHLRDVHFSYVDAEQQVFKGLNLKIDVGSWVGLVGLSGSGKSTLLDILLGLQKPISGSLVVDGQTIDEANLRSWQQTIGYVPQHIVMLDDTILRNICFGIPEDQIDKEQLEWAARVAQIESVILKDLPERYETRIGHGGVRLSGGQRQRIGIARALYRRPKILILDEATNALDSVTEDNFIRDLRANLHGSTVIMVAHRLSTTQDCDQIFVLEQGKIVASGTYGELEEHNPQFRLLARSDRTLSQEAR